jgi:hypothetical protein
MKLKIIYPTQGNRPGSTPNEFKVGNFYYNLCIDFEYHYSISGSYTWLNVDEFDCNLLMILKK